MPPPLGGVLLVQKCGSKTLELINDKSGKNGCEAATTMMIYIHNYVHIWILHVLRHLSRNCLRCIHPRIYKATIQRYNAPHWAACPEIFIKLWFRLQHLARFLTVWTCSASLQLSETMKRTKISWRWDASAWWSRHSWRATSAPRPWLPFDVVTTQTIATEILFQNTRLLPTASHHQQVYLCCAYDLLDSFAGFVSSLNYFINGMFALKCFTYNDPVT